MCVLTKFIYNIYILTKSDNPSIFQQVTVIGRALYFIWDFSWATIAMCGA